MSGLARRPRLAFSLALLGLLVLGSLLAPALATHHPNRVKLEARLLPPGQGGHLLGADVLGRDLWSRLVWGGRVSLLVAVAVVMAGATAGTLLGTFAGYLRGAFDEALMRLVDVLLAFPGILFALILVGLLGPGVGNVIVALSVTSWVSYARLARGQALKVREMQYVEAARALGAPLHRIVIRHLVPNLLGPVVVQASLGMASVMLAESALSFQIGRAHV